MSTHYRTYNTLQNICHDYKKNFHAHTLPHIHPKRQFLYEEQKNINLLTLGTYLRVPIKLIVLFSYSHVNIL